MIRTEAMEENAKMIEVLIERATEYGKTSFELAKLKAIDKTADVVSSFIPNFIAVVFLLLFMLFLSVGLAMWIGEILGNTSYGFFVIAAFYCIAAIFIHFVMHKWLKRRVCNNFIKQVFN